MGSHCVIEWMTLIDMRKKDSATEESYTGYTWLEKHQRREKSDYSDVVSICVEEEQQWQLMKDNVYSCSYYINHNTYIT